MDGYDQQDVVGLLKDRLQNARADLEEIREKVKALCEPVAMPRDTQDYFHYFCGVDSGNIEQLKENEPKRLKLYQYVSALLRCYANIANELTEAGYQLNEIKAIRDEVNHFSKMRGEVKLHSTDYIDLKAYEADMRHLIDTYIQAEESENISAFDDMSLIQLIVERGEAAVDALPKGIKKSETAAAETIENNVRKLIINESPIDPSYYQKMSLLLDALIEQRRKGALSYKAYLAKIVALVKQASTPGGKSDTYPPSINDQAKRALYNNLNQNESLASVKSRCGNPR